MPTSDKQLAANRANTLKSTGPRAPEGKARSSQNARTHGFTTSTFAVVPTIGNSRHSDCPNSIITGCRFCSQRWR
jgi:hypothetical protein